jgi:hypothetical protein
MTLRVFETKKFQALSPSKYSENAPAFSQATGK